jgi:hypothetical protein
MQTVRAQGLGGAVEPRGSVCVLLRSPMTPASVRRHNAPVHQNCIWCPRNGDGVAPHYLLHANVIARLAIARALLVGWDRAPDRTLSCARTVRASIDGSGRR